MERALLELRVDVAAGASFNITSFMDGTVIRAGHVRIGGRKTVQFYNKRYFTSLGVVITEGQGKHQSPGTSVALLTLS